MQMQIQTHQNSIVVDAIYRMLETYRTMHILNTHTHSLAEH